jgi:hypothetical protein
LSDADRRRMTSSEFRRQALGTIINALVWAAPLCFVPYSPMHLRYEYWTVLAMLMTVSAVIVPTVPLSTLLFSTIVAVVLRWFLHAVATGHGGVAALFVASIALGTIEAARHFLSSHLAAAGMAERNEVVSLLLREFDEDEADWLWQTDAQRRVRAVSDRFAEAMGMARADIEGPVSSALVRAGRRRSRCRRARALIAPVRRGSGAGGKARGAVRVSRTFWSG